MLFRDFLDLEHKLTAAEDKCQLLEKQLMYMRRMTQNPEPEPIPTRRQQSYDPTAYRSGLIQATDVQPLGTRSHPYQADKLAELERSQIKLTASQTLAEVC